QTDLLTDSLKVSAGCFVAVRRAFSDIAHDANAGENAANVVVHVLRDAQALPLDGVLHFDAGQAPLVSAAHDQAHNPCEDSQQYQTCQGREPARLPEMRKHCHREQCVFTPDAVSVAGAHAKSEFARRQSMEIGRATRAGFAPVLVQSVQSKSKTNLL